MTRSSIILICVLFVLYRPGLQAQIQPRSQRGATPKVSCNPAPCVLPNVRVSNGQGNAYPNVMASNVSNSAQIAIAAEDASCTSIQGVFATNDVGSSWSHSCLPTFDGVGEPIVAYDLNNVLYGGGVKDWTQIVLHSSLDNGAHWGKAKMADENGLGTLWPWLTVDTSVSSPYKNSIYLSSVHGGVNSQNTRLHVGHSSDGGQTWTGKDLDQWQFPSVDLFSHISIGPDGILYVTWLRCHRSQQAGVCQKTGVPILLAKSSDGGNSWTQPVVVSRVNLVGPDNCLYGCLPNTPSSVTNIPVTSVVGSGGSAIVYVIFYNWTGTQMQVEMSRSTDGGNTFDPPVRVTNSNVGDEFLPWISISQDGKVAVTWLDRRNDPGNTKYQPFLSISVDGVNFGTSRFLSTTLSDPGLSFSYLGESRSHVWVDNTVFASWMDTRSGEPRIELGGVQLF